jgi:hypothetical protein
MEPAGAGAEADVVAAVAAESEVETGVHKRDSTTQGES